MNPRRILVLRGPAPSRALALALALSAAACGRTLSVDGVTPSSGTAAGGDRLTIAGAGFENGLGVTIGGVPATILGVDLDRIVVLAPAATAGTVDVVVTGPDGQEALAPAPFEFLPLAATFSDASATLPADPVAVRGRGATAVDLDGDGDLDLVQAVRDGAPRILLNDGGTFTDDSAAWMPPAMDDTIDVAVGDVDGDGVLDLVTANLGTDGQVDRVYRGLPDGTPRFEEIVDALLPAEAAGSTDLDLVDVDADGDLDLVIADWQDGLAAGALRGVDLLINDGTGHFTAAPERLASPDVSVFGLAVADFDADGDPDVFAAVDAGDPLLFLNDGAGTFALAPPAWMPSMSIAAKMPAAGDVDGDGDVDLLLTNAADSSRLLLNDGSGRFDDYSVDLLPADPTHSEHATLVDVDLDGDLDLLLAKYGTGPDALYLNDGRGRMFDYSSRLPASGEALDSATVVADFDGDGGPDVFISADGSRGHLFLQDTPPRAGANVARPDVGAWRN